MQRAATDERRLPRGNSAPLRSGRPKGDAGDATWRESAQAERKIGKSNELVKYGAIGSGSRCPTKQHLCPGSASNLSGDRNGARRCQAP